MYRAFLFTTLLPTILLAKIIAAELVELESSRIIRRHQQYRQAVKSSNMIKAAWSEELADKAKSMLSTCPVDVQNLEKEAENSQLGMNIGFSSSVNPSRIRMPDNLPIGIVDLWGSQRANFQLSRGCTQDNCMEYLRMISAGMHKLGCAMAKCAEDSIMVCLYEDVTKIDEKAPYKLGKSCSECTADFPNCELGMCAPMPGAGRPAGEPDIMPQKPSIRPTPAPSPQQPPEVQPDTPPPQVQEKRAEPREEEKDEVLLSARGSDGDEPTTTSRGALSVLGLFNGFPLLVGTALLHLGYSS
uniref:Cysteine-rich venom protein Mr30 n=1 Tax=Schistocephalus solidus TaxID=70667 RepID=A0A0X3PVB3_SCHSO